MLTEEQKSKYIENGGGECPHCGSSDIWGSSVDIEGANAFQDVGCQDCQKTWTDTYTLTDVGDADD